MALLIQRVRGGKFRLFTKAKFHGGTIAKDRKGKPVDGGGYETEAQAKGDIKAASRRWSGAQRAEG